MPWPMWLSWLEHCPVTEEFWVRFSSQETQGNGLGSAGRRAQFQMTVGIFNLFVHLLHKHLLNNVIGSVIMLV